MHFVPQKTRRKVNMLTRATPDQIKELMSIFYKFKSIFPHLRFDYLQRKLSKNEVIYDSGVVITFTRYLRSVRVGSCLAHKDDTIIHQIANSNQGNGYARQVIARFFDECPGKVWLTVRSSNAVARKFYLKNGFCEVGTIEWSEKGVPLPGVVYLYDK
jgi:hypothetical protein